MENKPGIVEKKAIFTFLPVPQGRLICVCFSQLKCTKGKKVKICVFDEFLLLFPTKKTVCRELGKKRKQI